MNLTKCKSCGAEIAFVRTAKGKLAPISIGSKEKRWILTPGSTAPAEARLVDAYLPHFADCPDAASFRKEEN